MWESGSPRCRELPKPARDYFGNSGFRLGGEGVFHGVQESGAKHRIVTDAEQRERLQAGLISVVSAAAIRLTLCSLPNGWLATSRARGHALRLGLVKNPWRG